MFYLIINLGYEGMATYKCDTFVEAMEEAADWGDLCDGYTIIEGEIVAGDIID